MQMTTEARAWLDGTVRRILARHPLGDPERAGVTYELMSHLHAAGEARASAAGRAEVGREDLEAALADAGGADGLAAAFVQPLAKPVERVLLGRRVGALLLDVLLLGIGITFVHGAISYFLAPSSLMGAPADGAGAKTWILWLMPWGYHPLATEWVQILIALASAALVLSYFAWTEGQDGRSLGKRALGLRVIRTDGSPLTHRDALVRNIAKLSPALLLLDTLVMLLVFPNDKQRASDRLADTVVVRV